MKGLELLWCVFIVVIVTVGSFVVYILSTDCHTFRLCKYKIREEIYQPYDQPHQFIIRDGFTLPFPKQTLSIRDLIRQRWMEDLQSYLHTVSPNSLVSIVAADSTLKDMLINWLVSAVVRSNHRLSQTLVLSLDQPLYQTLTEHGINTVYMDPKELLGHDISSNSNAKRGKMFKMAMISKVTVMRLMNHWGYDVASYDIDAIILKNPEQLYYLEFKSSDMIGSRGTYPSKVRKLFGVTLCAGAFMIKSTPKTGTCYHCIIIPHTQYHTIGTDVQCSKTCNS